MISRWLEVAARIRAEVADLDWVARRVDRFWHAAAKARADRDAYLDAVALNLQSFYSGIERLFELIARHVDEAMPGGETWHRDLLRQMAREIEGRRPAVISEASAAGLEMCRRFRHLIRNLYAMDLAPERMAPVVEGVPHLWARAQPELLAFAGFLDDLARSASGA